MNDKFTVLFFHHLSGSFKNSLQPAHLFLAKNYAFHQKVGIFFSLREFYRGQFDVTYPSNCVPIIKLQVLEAWPSHGPGLTCMAWSITLQMQVPCGCTSCVRCGKERGSVVVHFLPTLWFQGPCHRKHVQVAGEGCHI